MERNRKKVKKLMMLCVAAMAATGASGDVDRLENRLHVDLSSKDAEIFMFRTVIAFMHHVTTAAHM